LSEEKEENYTWVLNEFANKISSSNKPKPAVFTTDREMALINSLRVVFPTSKNLLCMWHINKNVLANLRKYFPAPVEGKEEEWGEFMASWNSVTESITASQFESNWEAFSIKYNVDHRAAVDYISRIRIPHHEKFVRTFTD